MSKDRFARLLWLREIRRDTALRALLAARAALAECEHALGAAVERLAEVRERRRRRCNAAAEAPRRAATLHLDREHLAWLEDRIEFHAQEVRRAEQACEQARQQRRDALSRYRAAQARVDAARMQCEREAARRRHARALREERDAVFPARNVTVDSNAMTQEV